jgi:hypothetical protein
MGLLDQFYSRVKSLPQQVQALPNLLRQFNPPKISIPSVQQQINRGRQGIQQAVSNASNAVKNVIQKNQQQVKTQRAAQPKIDYSQVIEKAKQTIDQVKKVTPKPVKNYVKEVVNQPLFPKDYFSPKEAGKNLQGFLTAPDRIPLLGAVRDSAFAPNLPVQGAGALLAKTPVINKFMGEVGGVALGAEEKSIARTINPQLFATHLEKEGVPAKVGHILDVARAKLPEYSQGQIGRAQVEAVKEQIRNGTPINPLVIDEAGNILDGAHRLQALKEMGIKGVQTVIQKSKVIPTESATITSHIPTVPPSTPGGVEPPTDPVQKILTALKEAKPVRSAQEAMYSKARGERLARVIGVRGQQQGEVGFHKELGQLKGELPKAQYESIRPQVTQQDVDSLFNKVTTSPHITEWEKINAQTGLAKILSHEGGTVPTKSELKLLNDVFGSEFTKTVLSKRSNLSKIYDTVKDVANIPRALQSSIDFSAALRQGVFAAPSHPIAFAKAFKGQFKQAFSEKAFQEAQAAIKQRPTYELMKEHGLAVDTGSTLGPHEEAFASNLIEKFPIIGGLVRGSERGYTGFLNKFRADMFDDIIKNNPEVSQNAKFTKDAADLINNMTGRGKLPSKLEGASQLANSVFFSPKLIMSRINLLNPAYYARLRTNSAKRGN